MQNPLSLFQNVWTLDYCSPQDITTYNKSISIDSTKPLSELKLKLAEVNHVSVWWYPALRPTAPCRAYHMQCSHCRMTYRQHIYLHDRSLFCRSISISLSFYLYSQTVARSGTRRIQTVRGIDVCDNGRTARIHGAHEIDRQLGIV